jgi:alpha-glucosidase
MGPTLSSVAGCLPPFSADGWRVDVANMLGRQGETQLGRELGRAIRRAVREARPDAYLMGENFFDATGPTAGRPV